MFYDLASPDPEPEFSNSETEERLLRRLDLRSSAGFLRGTANLIDQLVDDDRDELTDVLSPPHVRDDKGLARCVYVAREALSDIIIEYGLKDPRRDEDHDGEVI